MLLVSDGAVLTFSWSPALLPVMAPVKLTTAPVPVWARLMAVRVRLPPVPLFRLTVDEPAATLIAPTCSEVLVLAVALEIPPVLLLFPQVATDGGAVILPTFMTKEDEAVRWMAGQVSFPQEYDLSNMRLEGQPAPPNHGVNLIATISALDKLLEARIALVSYWHKVQEDPAEADNAQQMLDKNNTQIEAVRTQIRELRDALWGMRPWGTRSDSFDTETDSDDEPEESEDKSDG